MQIMRAKGIYLGYLGLPQTHDFFFLVVAVICKCSYSMKRSGRGWITLVFSVIPHSDFYKAGVI